MTQGAAVRRRPYRAVGPGSFGTVSSTVDSGRQAASGSARLVVGDGRLLTANPERGITCTPVEAVSRSRSTLDEVARKAGVSRATASRVFSGKPNVAEAARQAVRQAAAELGYVPNSAARSLAAGRTESVGVVLPHPTRSGLFGDPMLGRLLRGIGDELSSRELQMVLFAPQSDADTRRLEQYLAGGHVDAVLVVALGGDDVLIERVQSHGIPLVFGGRPRQSNGVTYVDVDNRIGGRVATEHLVQLGRRRVAHIAGPPASAAARERLHGFREAMWNAALRGDFLEYGTLDRDGGELAMHRLLARTHEIDAVFVASDAMAVGAMWALQVVGLRVPDDVAVIGFDDSPVATTTQPALSSVRQPFEEMGRTMARLALNGHEPQQVMLGAELALRGSTVSYLS